VNEIEVVVNDLASDGLGMTELEGRTVRLRNALPGETVKARILKKRRGERLAEAFEVVEPSSERVEPACPYFPRCGGCSMQHLEYSQQVALKQNQLLEQLERVGVTPERVIAPTLGPRFHYRTKARFGVRVVGGRVLIGFRESFSNRVARMSGCLNLTPALSALIGPLKELLEQFERPDRIPQLEVAAGHTGSAIILRHLEPLSADERALAAAFADCHRVSFFGQAGGYETIQPIAEGAAEPYLGYGNPDFGLHYQFRAADFTQVNMTMNRKLVQAAVRGLAAPAGARVLDMFCGIGNFSLPLAATGALVTGLEAADEAVVRARHNAAANGLTQRCEFAVQDLYDAGCQITGNPSFMLLDPPRSGAGPNLENWASSGSVRRIAYVSCSPESFAGDAAILLSAGFSLSQVGIFDMFPNTAHVETLGVFQKSW
jgi:23S rRNA (uracil1939-C5)-methyltransferase